jgi:hypothetical protein
MTVCDSAAFAAAAYSPAGPAPDSSRMRFRGLPLCGGKRGNGLSRCKVGYLSGNLAQHYNLGELRVCSSARS